MRGVHIALSAVMKPLGQFAALGLIGRRSHQQAVLLTDDCRTR